MSLLSILFLTAIWTNPTISPVVWPTRWIHVGYQWIYSTLTAWSQMFFRIPLMLYIWPLTQIQNCIIPGNVTVDGYSKENVVIPLFQKNKGHSSIIQLLYSYRMRETRYYLARFMVASSIWTKHLRCPKATPNRKYSKICTNISGAE